jgi:hypothetical protein
VSVNLGTHDLGFPIIVTASICDSVVEAVCEVPQYEDKHFSILFARSLNVAEACTDLMSFATGISLRIEMESVLKPNGSRDSILIRDAVVEDLCTAFRIPPRNPTEQLEFEKTLKLVLQEPALQGSLSDLAQVIHRYGTTPTNCARVLDTLRKAIAPNEKKSEGWLRLRQIVKADDNYMLWVSMYSTETRHGDRITPIAEHIIKEMRVRTWRVTNRFIEFRRGGSLELDPIRFPLLAHDPSFPFPIR